MKKKAGIKLTATLAKQVAMKDDCATDIEGLSAFDRNRHLKVIVETPRGSRNKFGYDPDTRLFECHSTLPLGLMFPWI